MRPLISVGLLLTLTVLFLMTPARLATADVFTIDSGTVDISDIPGDADSVLVLPGGTLNVNAEGFNLPITLAGGIITNAGSYTVFSSIEVLEGTTTPFQMINANLGLVCAEI